MDICKDNIKEYLYYQEKIKNNMNKIKHECPDKVLSFMVMNESSKTINKLITCNWIDSVDKKFINKVLKTRCED